MSRRTFIMVILVIAVGLIGLLSLGSPASEDKPNTSNNAVTLQDAHGLAVDRKDSSKVYIATHTGLLVMQNDGELQRVGSAQDDYMGFSAHPTDPQIFYTSGHPRSGGNIGFQKSTDGGQAWQKVSDGVGGPVDFHSMTVSQAAPSLVYGVFRGQLQSSEDEGKTWEVLNDAPTNITSLATSTTVQDAIYAGTTNGLYISTNRGQSWNKLGSFNGLVTTLAINPKNDQEITAHVEGEGLVQSSDDGGTWKKLNSYSGNMVMHLAYDVQNPAAMYLINQGLEIHKTTDGGATWSKVR